MLFKNFLDKSGHKGNKILVAKGTESFNKSVKLCVQNTDNTNIGIIFNK